jgi:hypothetical protein
VSVRRASLAAWLAAALSGCGTPSGGSATAVRALPAADADVAWTRASRGDVVGYFESDRITGEAAASVRRVLYAFADDGTYSGAALVQEGPRATFQVLSGRWSLDGDRLSLGEGSAPTRVLAAPGRLRLVSEGGAVTFRRGKAE